MEEKAREGGFRFFHTCCLKIGLIVEDFHRYTRGINFFKEILHDDDIYTGIPRVVGIVYVFEGKILDEFFFVDRRFHFSRTKIESAKSKN